MRSKFDIDREIVNLILQAEICFDICKYIPASPGPGAVFLPFFYNLSFSRGLIILHSLLISKSKNEITINEYIKDYISQKDTGEVLTFKNDIGKIKKLFEKNYTTHLRHKIAAHLDKKYKHEDFVCAYMVPEKLNDYISVVSNLKDVFFKFTNYSQDNYLAQIKEESDIIINLLEQKNQEKGFDL